jgi:hypothetical protein
MIVQSTHRLCAEFQLPSVCNKRPNGCPHSYFRSGRFFRGGVFVRAKKKHSANFCNVLVKIMLWLKSVFSFARGFSKKHSSPLALPWEPFPIF